jgi:hypothetical protein
MNEKAPHEAGPVDGKERAPPGGDAQSDAIAGFQPRLRPVVVRRFQPAESSSDALAIGWRQSVQAEQLRHRRRTGAP